jgi:hypothetical protein
MDAAQIWDIGFACGVMVTLALVAFLWSIFGRGGKHA